MVFLLYICYMDYENINKVLDEYGNVVESLIAYHLSYFKNQPIQVTDNQPLERGKTN